MRRVLVTRSPHQASELAGQLRAAGLETVLVPAIEFTDPTSFAPLDYALAHLDTFHWLIFTSANAVEAFARRLTSSSAHPSSVILSEASRRHREAQSKDLQLRSPAALPLGPFGVEHEFRIAAIGPATSRAIEQLLGKGPYLVPPQAIAESLAEALTAYAHQSDGIPTHFLLVRAEQARDHLPDTLRFAGAAVTIAPAYRTLVPASSIAAIRELFSTPTNYPDAITFTSSSTATNLLALLQAAGLTLPPEIPRISIGPITSQTLRDLDVPPCAEAATPSIPALVASVRAALYLTQEPNL